MTITGSTIADNTGTQIVGAFALGESVLTLENSIISGNRSPLIPGIGLLGSTAYLITGSAVTGNTGVGGTINAFPDTGGSGIYNGGRLKVINSTISGNRGPANQSGVAIDNAGGNLKLINVAIADNTSGVRNQLGTVTVRNTIVATSVGGANCAGGVIEAAGAGFNLDSGETRGFTPGNHSLPNSDPQLNPLGTYGGPTQTQSPRIASPTRDRIPVANCPPPVPPTTASVDQRGVARPQGTACDIGAVENGLAPAISRIAPTTGTTSGGTALQISGTNFGAGATVAVGGLPCPVSGGVTATTITCVTPRHTEGAVDVTVTTTDGQGVVLGGGFAYDRLTIASLTPTSGSTGGGTPITIRGGGFVAGATVHLGTRPCQAVTVVDTTTITCTTPAGTPGQVDVAVINPQAPGTSGTATLPGASAIRLAW